MPEPIVLCYHALSPTWHAALSTTPERFERQISLLLARGYRGTTFSQAVHGRDGERVMAVTFDDAYRSVISLARPILEERELPATVFTPTDFIGSEQPMTWPGIDRWHGGPHEDELMPMSWQELQTLAAAGWEIGSHTCSHPHLTELDDDALDDELARSKAACEQELGAHCASLAYPYGDVDARVVAASMRAGYSVAAALPSRMHRGTALEWPRVGIYHRDGGRRFRLKVSPSVIRMRRSLAWQRAGSMARLLRR